MSEYILYSDKSELFECEVDVDGASLKNSIARLVVESNDLNIMFNGKIDNGKCIIPIKKMRGILEENVTGKIKLEIIVEDTYFSPWSSEFKVQPSKRMSVIVKEQSEPIRPKVVVSKIQVPTLQQKKNTKDSIIERSDISVVAAISELVSALSKRGINESTLNRKMTLAEQIINSYFIKNPQYTNKKDEIVKKTIKVVLDK